MTQPSDSDKPHRGRRISWEEFEKLTGRKRQAANGNGPAESVSDEAA